jgi:hypothetical protein
MTLVPAWMSNILVTIAASKSKAALLASLSVASFAWSGLAVAYAQEPAFETAAYARAVEFCRGAMTRPMALSADGKILCFDGWITRGEDMSPAERLDEKGLFVVRSYGGSVMTAMTLADLLRDRHATVVVYDYCFSACAGYLLIASAQTYVMKGSLVAWHHWLGGTSDCPSMEIPRDQGPRRLQQSPCTKVSPEQQQPDRVKAVHDRFYAERTIDRRFEYPPESFYVRKILKNMFEGRGVLPDVAWMWNPRYYKNTLKTRIVYEAYPESQTEVDELVARFRLRRIIYDP